MDPPLYDVVNLFHGYVTSGIKTDVFRGLNIVIHAGEFVLLKGSSGRGKTTLLSLLAGLDTPQSGAINFKDEDITIWNQNQLVQYRRSQVGIVFQTQNLIPHLTVEENIGYPLGLRSVPTETANKEVETIMSRFGLTHRRRQFPHQLSGGEAKRVALARAMINRPQVLLVDEPITGLDQQNGEVVLDTLRQINAEGTTVVISSHLEQVRPYVSRVIDLDEISIISPQSSFG